MSIYEVMSNTVDGEFKTKDDVRPYVHDALEECFADDDNVVERFGSFDAFVDVVLDDICSRDLSEEWLDGEAFSMMENVAFGILEMD